MPAGAREILSALHGAGYEAYVVGGCVRDSLLGRTPHDWDICTNAGPGAVERCLRGHEMIETGIRHGTVTVLIGGEPYEVTTYRVDGAYSDHRRPDRVAFVSDLREDLARRDFTVNAMAYNETDGLRDFFGGRDDLARGLIRCVGEADTRFEEDALRVLRALRFAATYGFAIEEETAAAIHRKAPLLGYVAQERLYAEMSRLLLGPGAGEILLRYRDVMARILPELGPSLESAAYARSARAVSACTGEDLSLRLALLLGTPGAAEGADPTVSARRALERLRVDGRTRDAVLGLLTLREAEIPPERSALCRWLNRIGEEPLRRLIALRRAECAADGESREECEALEQALDAVLRSGACYRLRDLAVGGRELRALGVPEGERIGRTLQQLLDAVIDGELPNEREALLARATELLKNGSAENQTGEEQK